MSERDSYNPGEFCWVDLAVPSTEAGAEFYNELLGVDWEQGAEEFGGYGMFTQKGKVVARHGPAPERGAAARMVELRQRRGRRRDRGQGEGGRGNRPRGALRPRHARAGWRSARTRRAPSSAIWQPRETPGAQLVNEVGTWTWNHLTPGPRRRQEVLRRRLRLEAREGRGGAAGSPFFMWQVEDQKWEEGIGGAMAMGEGTCPKASRQLVGLLRGRECGRGREDGERRRAARW